jgi:hypothetical protein
VTQAAPAKTATPEPAKPAPEPEAKPEAKEAKETETAEAAPAAEPSAEPAAASTAAAKVAVAAGRGAPAAGKGGAAPEDAKPAEAAQPAETAAAVAAAAPPAAPSNRGDLASAMEKAVGGTEKASPESQGAEPASGGPKPRSQNIPEQPSQGSVAAAIGAVMGNAKACVAGADDVSRAQITFSSNGSVSNVSVSGWAAANGAAGCIKAALKGANVGPFAKPSYTFGVNIRP